MDNTYKVVFSGKLKDGIDPNEFVVAFARMFKVPEEHARKLLHVTKPVTLKDNLDHAGAEKYRAVLEKFGMVVSVQGGAGLSLVEDGEAKPAAAPAAESAVVAASPAASGGERCPKCGSDRVQGDDCLACGIIISKYKERQARLAADAEQNPYAAPQSDVSPVSDSDSGEMTGPHSVPAGNGWSWIAGGWNYFKQNPLAWIGAIIVWFVMMMAATIIPLIGPLAVNLLTPVIMAGFMLGANEQREGGSFGLRHLFAGFSTNAGKLILVGLFYLIGMFLIMTVVAMVVGGSLFASMGQLTAAEANPEIAAAMMGPFLLAMLIAMALMMPLLMAYWFAPALVAFEDLGAFEAMKLSFRGCLKNVLPFLVYSVVAFALAFIAMIPFGLGMLVMAPVMIAAMYVSYRDIYYEAA